MKLTKWYYDLVSDSGQTFIGYAVYLKLFNLTLPWRSALLVDHSVSQHRQGLGRLNLSETDHAFTFKVDRYSLRGEWQKSTASRPCQLINTPNLSICWQGMSLNAPAQIHINDQTMTGLGYVERLEMDFNIARLPFNELHWGRFISNCGQKLLTWIQFDGIHATSQVFDGQHYYGQAEINQHHVHYAGSKLTMQLTKTLLETNISSHVPYWLEKIIGGSIATGHENKWLSQATFADQSATQYQGWVIHEVVKW